MVLLNSAVLYYFTEYSVEGGGNSIGLIGVMTTSEEELLYCLGVENDALAQLR